MHIVLQKLEHYDVRGVTQQWSRSYFNNRIQYVKINNTESLLRRAACGVPAGSVLGPMLFILRMIFVLYLICWNLLHDVTDDAKLFCSEEYMKEFLNTAKKELIKVKKWYNTNKLLLNENKTKLWCLVVAGLIVKTTEFRQDCNWKSLWNKNPLCY